MGLKEFVFFSLAGFLFSFYMMRDKEHNYTWFVRIFILITLMFSIKLGYDLFYNSPIVYPYFSDFGFTLKFLLDSSSFLFLILNVFLYFMLYFLISFERNNLMNALLLMLFCVNNLFFLSGDTLTFIIFWEAMLVPATLLLYYFSGERASRNALEFLLYNFGISIFMVLGILLMFKENRSFEFVINNMSQAGLITTLIYLGIMVKTPVFPFHGWLLNTYYNLPSYVTAIFSGVLSKYALFGFYRFFEKGAIVLSPLILITVFSALYAAFLAWSNRNLKKIFTFMSMSHLNVMLAGSLALLPFKSPYLLIPFALFHGVLAFALFLYVYYLEKTTQLLSIDEYGSLTLKYPFFTFFFTFFLLVLAGFPLFGYFYLEFTLLSFLFKTSLLLGFLLSLGIAINLLYKSLVFYKMIFEKKEGAATLKMQDLSLPYLIFSLLIFLSIIALTIYLHPILYLLSQGGLS